MGVLGDWRALRKRGALSPRGRWGVSLVSGPRRAAPRRSRNVFKWYGVLTDIEDRKRTEALIAGEKRILEMVAKGTRCPDILNSLCRLVEEQARDVLASILLSKMAA